MKQFLEEEDAKKAKEQLLDHLEHADDLENKEFHEGMNWIDTNRNYYDLKAESKGRMGDSRFFFLCHSNDILKGKPQLIHQTRQTITLIRRIHTKKDNKEGGGFDLIIEQKFIDETYDKRYDGKLLRTFSQDFWVYRIVNQDHKEYYVLSEKELPTENCSVEGMIIKLDDVSEFSKSMKIKSIANLFIAKDFEPNVKIITKQALIDYTKENKITEESWFTALGLHPFGNINNFQKDIQLLRSSFILAGKHVGYPLHLAIMGVAGTKKTMGHIETLSYKFSEESNICEGANTRIKGLSPSFKEKPANIGYLAKADRVAWIDEIGKMIQAELVRHQMQTSNILGDLNFLFEHKKRTVSSGNDNECTVQATAKFMIVTNPVGTKSTIHNHVGIIDPTMMSRVLWWVQDESETEFALSPESVIENPPHTNTRVRAKQKNSLGGLGMCWGDSLVPQEEQQDLHIKIENRDDFLTIFDTTYSFLCKMDKERVQKLVDMSINLAKEPMKSSVWKPRAFHHVYLLLDGLVKHRCLFKDYDSTFEAKDEDYQIVERLLIRMINGWETNFVKKRWNE